MREKKWNTRKLKLKGQEEGWGLGCFASIARGTIQSDLVSVSNLISWLLNPSSVGRHARIFLRHFDLLLYVESVGCLTALN